MQSVKGGIGDDWAYFGCFANPNTGLTPFEAQGDFYVLAAAAPEGSAASTRITGFGVDNSPPEWNQAQQTATGPYLGGSARSISYEVDTRGGNSGSAVVDEKTGLAIGIHTNGGCTATGGANYGTSIGNPVLQEALANPLGVCQPPPSMQFVYPKGMPDFLDPAGQTILVQVLAGPERELQLDSVRLEYDAGGGPVVVELIEIDRDLFEAVFPSVECGTEIAFFLTAEATGADSVTDPVGCPEVHVRRARGGRVRPRVRGRLRN